MEKELQKTLDLMNKQKEILINKLESKDNEDINFSDIINTIAEIDKLMKIYD